MNTDDDTHSKKRLGSSRMMNKLSRSKSGLTVPVYLKYQTYFKNTKKYEKEVAAFWRVGFMLMLSFGIVLLLVYRSL